MKNIADCIDSLRQQKGFRSDREVGELLDCSQQAVAQARRDKCTDPIAVKLADLLGEDPGRLLLMARAERERDPTIRAHLVAFAKKSLAAVPARAVSALAALAVALGMSLSPREAMAVGGAGGSRH